MSAPTWHRPRRRLLEVGADASFGAYVDGKYRFL